MAEVITETKTAVQISADFWHTAIGITIKRVAWQAAAAAAVIVFGALTSPSINWHEVLIAARVQVAYVVLATLQTVSDPQIPNTVGDTISVKK